MLKRQLKFQSARRTPVFPAIAAAAILLFAHWLAGAPLQTGDRGQSTGFNDSVASGLLSQIANGFESRNQNKVLGAFDLAAMPDGQLFKQQIVSFFSHTENVRIHINLVQTSVEAGKGTAEADVEMEAAPRDSNDLPVHKQDRLRFTAANTPAGWKFSDVQPRSFFSLQASSSAQ